MSRKEILDKIQSKWISRKLLVFVVACFGLFSGNLTSSDWVVIATAYISLQGVTDIVERLYKTKNEL
jgi:hypothetical protein